MLMCIYYCDNSLKLVGATALLHSSYQIQGAAYFITVLSLVIIPGVCALQSYV
jgi:hypothetical protein